MAEAGSVVLVVVELLLLYALLFMIWRHYTLRRRASWWERVTVLCTYSICMSCFILVTTDLSTCLQSRDGCAIVNSAHRVVTPNSWTVLWTALLWTLLTVAWIIVPIVRGYGESGHFTFWSRVGYSVKENLLIYGIIGGLCAVYIIYAAIKNSLDFHGIYGMAIAMSNAFGLLVVMILLGYGLVEVPRFFFRAGNRALQMDLQAYRAVDINADLVKTQEELSIVLGVVQELDHYLRTKNDAEVRHFLDVIIGVVEEYYSSSGTYSTAEKGSIRLEDIQYDMGAIRKKMVHLHERAKAAVERYQKERIRWRYYQNQYEELEDLVEARRGKGSNISRRTLGLTNPFVRFLAKTRFKWKVYCVPVFNRVISIIFAILSCIVLWCEVTMFLAASNYRVSIVSLMMDSAPSNFFLLQMIVLIPLVYIAFVCYFSLFRAKFFSFYEFVPHYSDNQTMLFNALFVSRFTLPICYNLLMFVREDQLLNGGEHYNHINGTNYYYSTGFSSVLGVMDVVPLLGEKFNLYFPIVLIILLLMNLFHIWGWLFRLCGAKRFVFDEHETSETVERGRTLLLHAINKRKTEGEGFHFDPLAQHKSTLELAELNRAEEASSSGTELPDNHPLSKYARLREERDAGTSLHSNVNMKQYGKLDDLLSSSTRTEASPNTQRILASHREASRSTSAASAPPPASSSSQRSVLDRFESSAGGARGPGGGSGPTISSATTSSSLSRGPTAGGTSSSSRNALRSLYDD